MPHRAIQNYNVTRGHGVIQSQTVEVARICICGPTTARVCADIYGSYYHLRLSGPGDILVFGDDAVSLIMLI